MDSEILLKAGMIFVLRVVGNVIVTLRMVMLIRGLRLRMAILAAIESLIFALALWTVVSDLSNVWTLGAYSIGFAVGGYIGMDLERRLIQRFVAVQIVSPKHAHAIAEAVRKAGHGATEGWGQGVHGQVGSVRTVVPHQEVDDVVKIAHEIDPNAFITLEELRGISHGYFRRWARHGH